jgi:hypothetical protein
VGYRVLSEPDRQLLMNVRWLAGFREPPVDLDGERERMLVVLSGGPSTIAELLCGSWEVALACPVLMNMMWTGVAMLDVGIPIGAESRVWASSRTGACDGGGVAVGGWRSACDRWRDGVRQRGRRRRGARLHGCGRAGPVRAHARCRRGMRRGERRGVAVRFGAAGRGRVEQRAAALAQISQRFKRLPVEPLRRSSQTERARWLGVLQVFERELVLLQAKEGDLTGQADYLWRRTQGLSAHSPSF